MSLENRLLPGKPIGLLITLELIWPVHGVFKRGKGQRLWIHRLVWLAIFSLTALLQLNK